MGARATTTTQASNASCAEEQSCLSNPPVVDPVAQVERLVLRHRARYRAIVHAIAQAQRFVLRRRASMQRRRTTKSRRGRRGLQSSFAPHVAANTTFNSRS